jgi:prevent-host-death family protein
MCYMEKVGVRELRQNLSVYLRRVARGERLEVTDRGRPVAVLAPLPRTDSTVARLVAAGRARAAEGDLMDLGPPLPNRRGERLSDAVRELREDRS